MKERLDVLLVKRGLMPSREKAKAVIMGYEGTPLAQEYAAQVIFGGVPAKGKLPVTIPGLFHAGSGIFTEKTRLGYHEPEEEPMPSVST